MQNGEEWNGVECVGEGGGRIRRVEGAHAVRFRMRVRVFSLAILSD